MTNSWEFSNTPAGRVLRSIQVRGRANIKDVASDLGVTASAVRLHLAQLEARGAIHSERVRVGVGRPFHVYTVTPEAHSLFYRDDGDLARLVLEEVSATQGTDALQTILQRVGDRLALQYQERVAGRDLTDRVRAWAALLDERGVVVQIEESDAGYVLQEFGCPYQNVALGNRAVCEMERQVMVRLLRSGVKLTRCMLDGEHGCQFDISGRPPNRGSLIGSLEGA